MNGKVFAGLVLGVSVLCFFVFAAIFDRSDSQDDPMAVAPADPNVLVRAHSPVKGPESAPVTVVEFLDPECESCRAMYPIVQTLLAEYPDQVRLVIRYMPLHANAALAAASLEEARELGKYDAALEKLFATQPIWGSHHDPKPELIATYLAEIGIDPERLRPEAVLPKHRAKIEQDEADGRSLGVRATPVFFVNGVQLPQLGYAPLKRAIDTALARAGGTE